MVKEKYELQKNYIDRIKNINENYFKETGKRKTAFINTFGCQMNVRDSETLKGILHHMGYIDSKEEYKSDLIIYNTCCVRENAENKVYGNLGNLKIIKKENPNLKIIVCGCMMQQDAIIKNIKKSYSHVDVIFGTFNLQRFPELLVSNIETKRMIIDVWEDKIEIVEDLPAVREEKFKASVNIMFGCNNYCTYCIVPYVRGKERSRDAKDILEEVKNLADDGVKEILLLGQNVNSYGKNLDDPISFSNLLEKICEVQGIERIRFITSHPKDISEDLLLVMKNNDKICKHLHFPFQSGSNEILKKMNRRYTREHYLKLVDKAREIIPNIGLTTDVIVGFPGETEEDFNQTLDVIKKSLFSAVYTFVYSKRIGTPAASMENQIEDGVIKNRFSRLLKEVNLISNEINQSFIGKNIKVLVEEVNNQNNELVTGRSEQNTTVHFKGDRSLIGEIVNVKIVGCKSFYMMGEQL